MNRDTSTTVSQGNVIATLQKTLEQLPPLLYDLNNEEFSRKGGGIINGSIGEHVRHSLDHIDALLTETNKVASCTQEKEIVHAQVAYDKRIRGGNVEKDVKYCIQKIHETLQNLNKLALSVKEKDTSLLDHSIQIEHVLSKEGHSSLFPSYIGRELMFVFHHLLHHNAMIAIRLRLLEKKMDTTFGLAPSTPFHPVNSW